MEDIDLKELFMIFWNKKIQIILFIILFAIIGGIYTIGFIKPMYTASTTLVLATSSGENTQDATNSITTTDVTLNSKLVSTYSELVKSKKVLRKVISNLNIDVKEESLRKNITVSSVKDTELIEITVSNEEPIYATQIANEIANVFSEEVNDIYNINNIHVVDTAEVPKEPSNVNVSKNVILFAFVGLVIAIIYALIANMLDTTVKSAEEIIEKVKEVAGDKNYGIPVIAAIPLIDNFENEKGGRK